MKNGSLNLSKIPTGIDSFDPILDGGFPRGSLVLLLGEAGAGDFEFLITSLARLLMKDEMKDTDIKIPEKIYYISFTRSKEDIFKEIAFSFPDFYKVLQKSMNEKRFEFKDLSEIYFTSSFIPYNWMTSSGKEFSFESLKHNEEEKNLIESLIEYIDKNANESIIIIDSLTALAQHCLTHMKWNDYILFLHGLQKVTKNLNSFVYALLTSGIFEGNKQEEILECMDGAIFFEWDNVGPSQRQRVMYMKKFRGVLPRLDQDNIVNFETKITTRRGFEVSNIKRVRGR